MKNFEFRYEEITTYYKEFKIKNTWTKSQARMLKWSNENEQKKT
jgi:hypothetical protein